ncbi:MAG: endolytic transglycosylase MltG, partial [bacterium]
MATRKAKTPAKKQATRRFPIRALVILLAIIISLSGATYWALFRPIPRNAPETVNITAKTTVAGLANSLQEKRIIPSAPAFRLYARVTGHTKIKEGVYTVTSGMRPVDMLTVFVGGHSIGAAVTIPEGKWASEIAEILKKNWPDAAAKLPEIVANPKAWEGKVPFPLPSNTLEGYLFPDTYHFPPAATAEQITEEMLKTFAEKCWKEYQQKPATDTRTLHEVLTLASLVESEARKDDERAKIA